MEDLDLFVVNIVYSTTYTQPLTCFKMTDFTIEPLSATSPDEDVYKSLRAIREIMTRELTDDGGMTHLLGPDVRLLKININRAPGEKCSDAQIFSALQIRFMVSCSLVKDITSVNKEYIVIRWDTIRGILKEQGLTIPTIERTLETFLKKDDDWEYARILFPNALSPLDAVNFPDPYTVACQSAVNQDGFKKEQFVTSTHKTRTPLDVLKARAAKSIEEEKSLLPRDIMDKLRRIGIDPFKFMPRSEREQRHDRGDKRERSDRRYWDSRRDRSSSREQHQRSRSRSPPGRY